MPKYNRIDQRLFDMEERLNKLYLKITNTTNYEVLDQLLREFDDVQIVYNQLLKEKALIEIEAQVASEELKQSIFETYLGSTLNTMLPIGAIEQFKKLIRNYKI